VSAAAHTLEDCFVILRDRTDLSALEPATVTLLLQGVDALKKITTESIHHSDVSTPDQQENLETIAQIQAQFEAKYGRPESPPVPVISSSPAPETLKLIFEHELPPVFDRLETELSQASETDLAKSVTAINQVYYQLSGLAGMLQLPDFGKIAEPLRDLIESKDLTLERLQSEGWAIAQNLQTARGQILAGKAIEPPEISPIAINDEQEGGHASTAPTPGGHAPSTPTPGGHGGTAPTPPVPNPQRQTIRVDLERLTELVNLVGELVINRTNLEQSSASVAVSSI